jgi:arsenite oxidase small subunit
MRGRREFLESCALLGGAAAVGALAPAWADEAPRLYSRARLVEPSGAPVRARALVAETNYVFHYPFASTPCFLLRLKKPTIAGTLKREDGAPYAWNGGVGPDRTIVAYSAICAHKLAYPTRDVSFIRYQKDSSATSSGGVIHCCADHSVYDPAAGARVLSGPAPQPLAAILLAHDAATDEIVALGTVGAEQFNAFFDKYAAKLAFDHSGGRPQAPVGDTTVVRELSGYSRSTIQC